eukprot:354462-Chlamydomonas_euryale.AAC.1
MEIALKCVSHTWCIAVPHTWCVAMPHTWCIAVPLARPQHRAVRRVSPPRVLQLGGRNHRQRIPKLAVQLVVLVVVLRASPATVLQGLDDCRASGLARLRAFTGLMAGRVEGWHGRGLARLKASEGLVWRVHPSTCLPLQTTIQHRRPRPAAFHTRHTPHLELAYVVVQHLHVLQQQAGKVKPWVLGLKPKLVRQVQVARDQVNRRRPALLQPPLAFVDLQACARSERSRRQRRALNRGSVDLEARSLVDQAGVAYATVTASATVLGAQLTQGLWSTKAAGMFIPSSYLVYVAPVEGVPSANVA